MTSAQSLFDRHHDTLQRAVAATRERAYWSAYPESLKAYGEGGVPGSQSTVEGKAAFEAYLGKPFPLDGVAATAAAEVVGDDETSPYGFPLGITYPVSGVDAMLHAATAAMPRWRDAGPQARAGVCLEILARINARSPEMAHAVMHTSGQGYPMAFQAGGPHAQDRALEAIAYVYSEMERHVDETTWEKPQGKRPSQRLKKRFAAVPRGVALVIGCNTFPTWNSYPGLFASLVAGNPVVVKPHPRAVLPLAITVAIAREVLVEAGYSADLISLVAEPVGGGIAKTLAVHPDVRIIDYTGSTSFGMWLERNAPQATVYTEKAGVNSVVIDSVDDYQGMLANLAFSLSLYSGQMCTTPQNILVPRDGITTNGQRKSVEDVGRDLAIAVDQLLGDDARASAVLGAIVNRDVLERVEAAPTYGKAILTSRAVTHPEFAEATVRTPALVGIDASERDTYFQECFGPVSFLITTDSTAHSLEILHASVRGQGAITALVHSTDPTVLDAAEQVALDAGVSLSCNLTKDVYVNQSAAFSDFHATGANPAANASLTDVAFVSGRFHIIEVRTQLPDAEPR